MSKTKHGWVIEDVVTNRFVFAGDEGTTKPNIKVAYVYPTRKAARAEHIFDEVVRKVSLTAKGKAKKIISGR